MTDMASAPTLVGAWTAARKLLTEAGIDSPAIDARLLLEAAADVTRVDIVTDPHRILPAESAERFAGYLDRRARREPVSQIVGRKGFWKIIVGVNNHVLTPRPDTEVIVDIVLAAFEEQRRFSMLDLGIGSGAMALAILAERPHAKALGIDISEEALAVARDNAANLGLDNRLALLRGDWTEGLGDAGFDLVVSNPPYIPTTTSRGSTRRSAITNRTWRSTAARMASTPIACSRQRCCACSGRTVSSRSRLVTTKPMRCRRSSRTRARKTCVSTTISPGATGW